MKKFLLGTIVFIIALAGAWYFLPSDSREKAALFFGLSPLLQNSNSAKSFVASKIAPQSPSEKRALLLKELNRNLATAKQSILSKSASKTLSPQENNAAAENIAKLIGSSENIVKQLEEIDKNDSGSGNIIERIVNVFSPGVGNNQCVAQ